MSADATPPAKPESTGLNWPRAIALALGLGLAIFVLRGLAESDFLPQLGRFVISLDASGWLILAGLLLVAGFFAAVRIFRLSRTTVAVVVGATIALFAAASCFVRVESFSGNLFPRLAWRWTPTAEERFRAYEAEQAARRLAQPKGEAAGASSDSNAEPSLASPTEHDFPQFLGPNRLGVLPDPGVDLAWNERPPKELWRHPVGLGWGGFSVVGESAFTQEQRGDDECVVAYSLRTGEERWVHRERALFAEVHGNGPRATPTVDRGRVFTMGATGIVSALDAATGRSLWKYAALPNPETQNLQWGMSGSPLVLGELVVVAPGLPGASLVALRCETGEVAWQAGDDPAAYASPITAELAGRKQILNFNGAGLRGHDAADGRPLWLFPWVTMGSQRVNVAQPLVLSQYGEPNAESLVLISSGYAMGTALVRVVKHGDEFQAEEVWTSKGLKSKFSNLIVQRGAVYGLDDGIMAALELKTGEKLWKRGRYGHGQMLLVGELLWIQAEEGELVLVAPSREGPDEFAKFPALTSKTWNHPTLAGRLLLVRNDREAAAFELAPAFAK